MREENVRRTPRVTYGNGQGHIIYSRHGLQHDLTVASNTLLDLSITISISSGLSSPVWFTRKERYKRLSTKIYNMQFEEEPEERFKYINKLLIVSRVTLLIVSILVNCYSAKTL